MRRFNTYQYWVLLAHLVAGLGCQVREAGDSIIDPEIKTLEWYAHVVPQESGYAVRFQWNPAVPVTLTRQKKAAGAEWEFDGTMVVSNLPQEGPLWKTESNTEYRFSLETADSKIDVSKAAKYLYAKIPEDRVLVGENNELVQTSSPLSLGRAKLTGETPAEFTGGKFEVTAESFEASSESVIRLHNEGKPKTEKFHFRLFAKQSVGRINVEIGPFDPEGPAPLIDLSLGYGDEARLTRKGTQHPRQQIRLRQNGEIFFFVEDALVPLPKYEGLYAAKREPERPAGERFMMVAQDGKLCRFGKEQNGKWRVVEDFNFYPALVDFSQYDKVDWSDTFIPEPIRNVKAIQSAMTAIRSKWKSPTQVVYNLTQSYENLPDRKQTEVLQEMSARAEEIQAIMTLTGVDDVIFNNGPARSPVILFFARRPLHSLGIGMEGTPKEIVDILLTNLREARKQIKEN